MREELDHRRWAGVGWIDEELEVKSRETKTFWGEEIAHAKVL